MSGVLGGVGVCSGDVHGVVHVEEHTGVNEKTCGHKDEREKRDH